MEKNTYPNYCNEDSTCDGCEYCNEDLSCQIDK